jgi:hypothetical protein
MTADDNPDSERTRRFDEQMNELRPGEIRDVKKPPVWAGETATSYFPRGLPPKYREG